MLGVVASSSFVAGGGSSNNDYFADAITVVIPTDGATYTHSGTIHNLNLTMEVGEPYATGYNPTKTAWWKYTPATSGTITVSTTPTVHDPDAGYTNTDTEMAIYTGSAVNALTKLASDSDSVAGARSRISNLAVTAGTTYHIQVAAYNGNRMFYGLDATGPAST